MTLQDPLHFARQGVVAATNGQLEAAAGFFNLALEVDPRSWQNLCNLGKVCFQQQKWLDAQNCFEQAYALNPECFDAYFFCGLVSFELKNYATAITNFEKSLALRSRDVEVWMALGNVHQANGQANKARACYEQSLAINPQNADAHFNRGIALQTLGDHAAAADCYDAATQLQPHYTKAFFNWAVAYERLGRGEEALRLHLHVLTFDLSSKASYFHMAGIYAGQGEEVKAEALYRKAMLSELDNSRSRWNLSHLLLNQGRYTEGWSQYEARWSLSQDALSRHLNTFQAPLWLGQESLIEKLVVLWPEQGLGDTLQFCRYATMLADRGASVVLQVPRSLVTLLQNSDHRITVNSGEPVTNIDFHCPLMSLPLACGTDSVEKIPAQVPYLFSDSAKRQVWCERLAQRLGARCQWRVGLVWSGGIHLGQPEVNTRNQHRNIPLATLANLKHPAIDFISLQKGEAAEQELADLQAAHWDGPAITSYSEHLQDFSDTAALIDNLDLVIAVDTAVAHLAGAMDKPVWILNRFNACWRWLYGENLNRIDSPWYPTARLFRQPKLGDWDSVIEQVRVALIDWQLKA